jgi:hypothetical protein
MSSLRLRSLSSLHRFLAAMTPSAHMAGIPDGLHLTSVRQPHYFGHPSDRRQGVPGKISGKRARRASRVTRSALASDLPVSGPQSRRHAASPSVRPHGGLAQLVLVAAGAVGGNGPSLPSDLRPE